MDKRIQHLKTFFNLYAERFTNAVKNGTPDIEGTAKSFSDCFIAANPLGVTVETTMEISRLHCRRAMRFIKTSV